jgi:hypothetical protein
MVGGNIAAFDLLARPFILKKEVTDYTILAGNGNCFPM